MKTILILLAGFLPFSPSDSSVYICKGPGSKKYHAEKDCRGLRNCSTEISKVTVAYASGTLGRGTCGYCY